MSLSCYIWRRTSPVTCEWHNEGGLLVIAESLDASRVAASLALDFTYKEEPQPPAYLTDDPGISFPVDAAPMIEVFPDAGCC